MRKHNRPLNRNRQLRFAALLILTLLAAPRMVVLGGGTPSQTQPGQAKAPATVIRVRFEAEPGTLNPWLQYSIYTQFLAGYIYESLLTQDGTAVGKLNQI